MCAIGVDVWCGRIGRKPEVKVVVNGVGRNYGMLGAIIYKVVVRQGIGTVGIIIYDVAISLSRRSNPDHPIRSPLQ